MSVFCMFCLQYIISQYFIWILRPFSSIRNLSEKVIVENLCSCEEILNLNGESDKQFNIHNLFGRMIVYSKLVRERYRSSISFDYFARLGIYF